MAGLIVALDRPDPGTALALASPLAPYVSGFKVGLELLLGIEPYALERVVELGLPVFVDAKLHDIPATVGKAAHQLGRRGARWVTAHLSGGQEMVRAATDGLDDSSSGEAGILGISVLTSLNRDDLEMVGVGRTVEEQVVALLEVARIGGAEGVVCSVHEAPVVKKVHPQLRVFTPGIRAQGSAAQDQKRVATPEEALRSGSDYLVVGRAITDAQDPIAAAISVASVIDIATK